MWSDGQPGALLIYDEQTEELWEDKSTSKLLKML